MGFLKDKGTLTQVFLRLLPPSKASIITLTSINLYYIIETMQSSLLIA